MFHRYSIAEARSSLPTIVDQAEAGVEVQLTRRGRPVVAVVAIGVLDHLRGERPRFGRAYREFLKHHSLEAIGVDPDFFAPARAKGVGRRVPL